MSIRVVIIAIAMLTSLAMAMVAFSFSVDTTPIDRPFKIPTSDVGLLKARAPDEGQLMQIASRPLMSPSRRPYVEKAEEPEAIAPEMTEDALPDESSSQADTATADVKLLGVELSRSGTSALVIASNGEKAEWHKIGDDIGGWSIVQIDADSMTLGRGEGDGQSRIVPLYREADACSDC